MIGGVRVSDTIYRIIPESYDFLPLDTRAADGAVEMLKMYVQADKISWECFEDPIFVDCGDGLETVTCPFCGSNIDIDVWQEMMSTCYEKSCFNNLAFFFSAVTKKLH
jgi:hypothetical protein